MRKRAYAAWKEVQEPFTTILYDIIADLLRIQYRHDTLHLTGMLQAIADSIEDSTQSDAITVQGLNILSCLNLGSQSSPLDGVILQVLQSKWNGNSLTPTIWKQGHLQRRALHVAGGDYGPDETARFIVLTFEVMHAHCPHSSPSHVYHLTRLQRTARDSFLRTGSHWIRDFAIIDMSNLSRIGLLCTELLLRILTHMRDEPITAGHCIHTLCLLSSTAEIGGRIRDLAGVDIIMKLLPHQFQDKRRETTPQETANLYNKNLRLTLRTLRNLTGPNLNLPHCPRLDTEARANQPNRARQPPRTLTQTCTRFGRVNEMTGREIPGPPWLSSTDWKRKPTILNELSGVYNIYPRNTTQPRCWEWLLLKASHLEDSPWAKGHWRTENSSGPTPSRVHSLIHSPTWWRWV